MGQYDSAWKDIIMAHFFDFLAFYFPEIEEMVDRAQEPEFLETELEKLRLENEAPGRVADLLVKVGLKSERSVLLFCHVEVQGRRVPDFTTRLFQYAYRIYDRLHSFPLTLAVLTDDDASFFPDAFEITTTFRYVRVEFHVAKLLYYEEKLQTLSRSSNPFAFVTLVQLEVNRIKRQENCITEQGTVRPHNENLYLLKKRLSLFLSQYGFSAEYISSLFLFLDWMVQLPKELEHNLDEEIKKETGGTTMPYVTHWERFAAEKARLEDKRDILIRLLKLKFSLTDQERNTILSTEDTDKLDSAIDAFVFAETKDEVLCHLA